METSELEPGNIVQLHNGNFARIIKSDRELPLGMTLALVGGPTKFRVPLPIYLYSIVKVRYNDGTWEEITHNKWEINQKRLGLKGEMNVSTIELKSKEFHLQERLNEINEEIWETEDKAVLNELKCEKTLIELELSNIRLGLYVESTKW